MTLSWNRSGGLAVSLAGCLLLPYSSGTAAAADAWEPPRLLTDVSGVVAASGTDVVLADWVDTSPDADTPQASLRLQRSSDDGATFSAVAEPAGGTPPHLGQAYDAVVFGAGVALVVSRTDGPEGPATRLDRHETEGGWSPPALLQKSGCSPEGRAVVAASDTSVLVADSCGIWRSQDGGGSFDEVAAPAPASSVEALTAVGTGFSLLYNAIPSGSTSPRLFSSASVDDGVSFSAPVQLTPSALELVDSTRAARDLLSGTVVAVTNVRKDQAAQQSSTSGLRLEVRRSSDGGRTWSAPAVLNDGLASAADAQGFPPLPAATESGLDLSAAAYASTGARQWLRWTSADGGATWTRGPAPADVGGDQTDRPASSAGGAVAHLLREGAYTRTSGAANGTDPGADLPPTLSLNPATISAGQPTTVTYRGTPGSTVDILSRTQPATVFSKIGSVTLGSDGTGTSTHRPQKNTRITARTSSGQLSETAPIIAVRSVASFNVSRVGTRTYTFTGRVYPALRNRLVNLYRNGTLVGQGRCDATGIYTITRTLGAGTFTFQVRTPNDQDNLGTTSRALSVAIR